MTSGLLVAVVAASPDRVEGRIMKHIEDCAERHGIAVVSIDPVAFGKYWSYIKCVMVADVILAHSPLLLCFPFVLVARLFRTSVISLVWDVYPVTLGGKRYDRRLTRKLCDFIEHATLSLSRAVVVPSKDFLTEPQLKRAEFVGLWHPLEKSVDNIGGGGASGERWLSPGDETIQVLFAGQINETRGLPEAVSRLEAVTGGKFHLRVASSDPLPAALSDRANIEHLGYLDRRSLRDVAASCDCGLVSLAESLDGPGLPSKSFEYLEAGIPCIYTGKRLSHYLDVLERSGAGISICDDTIITLTRAQILERKRCIDESISRFMAVFELDFPALADRINSVWAG